MDDATLILSRPGASRHVALVEALADGVSPTWTEAVAIVREVATQLHRGGEPYQVPGLEDIGILSNGGVLLTGGRPYPAGEVAGVGVLMSQLLERVGAPQQVLDVQQQALADPPVFATLIDFHNALDFYARPDAQGVLSDYYTRASAAVEVISKNRALEALKEKAKSPSPKEQDDKPKQGRRPIWVVAVALIVASLAALAVYGLYGSPSSTGSVGRTATAALAAIGDTGKAVQDATTSAISKLVGGATEAAPEPANVSPAVAVVEPPPRPRTRARIQPAPVADPPAAAVATVAPPATPATAGAAVRTDPPPVEIPPIDTTVYTTASTEVIAPELVYPQLPSEQQVGAGPGQPGNLDLLILEDGTVGEARLVPQSNRLQDRMMVSAAKAWRFRPALKDGRPVRYRMRIPITW